MLGAVADLEPGQRQWQRDLAVARSALADVLLAQADVAGAAAVHTSALDVLQALAGPSPADTGDPARPAGGLGQGRPAAPAAAAIAAAALAAHASCRRDRRRAGGTGAAQSRVAARSLGGPARRRRRAPRERRSWPPPWPPTPTGLAIRERLAAAAPDDLRHQRDLAVALERVAVTRHALGDTPGALEAWRQALAISEAAGRGPSRQCRPRPRAGDASARDRANAGPGRTGRARGGGCAAAARAGAAERRRCGGPAGCRAAGLDRPRSQARLAALTDQGAVGTAPPPSQQAGRP